MSLTVAHSDAGAQHTRKRPRRVVNRLNDLDGKQWLPFQKSWFRDHTAVHEEFIRFFTKRRRPDGTPSVVLTLAGTPADRAVAAATAAVGRQSLVWPAKAARSNRSSGGAALTGQWNADCPMSPPEADYVLVDLRGRLPTLSALRTFLQRTAPFWSALGQSDALRERGYATVLIDNRQQDGVLVPVAWELAQYLGGRLTLKDEKIGCRPPAEPGQTPHFETDGQVYYALNFRREPAPCQELVTPHRWPEVKPHGPRTTGHRPLTGPRLCSWFVPRPPPREPGVLLHPAKYPETLVAGFVERCTRPGDLVLDPMVGTGSTLLACHRMGRHGFGVELNPEYAAIAQRRLAAAGGTLRMAHVVEGDALRLAAVKDLPPQVDYCITSPPYWDMLNMRGAMTQRGRRQRGLHVSYGDDPRDVGNVAAYGQFVAALVQVYRQVAARLRPGGYLTVIVKNVKKQGTIYPLAWDLAAALAEFLQVCPERLWCQDDVKLAPYGYGNAWVSNTVHHYCLTFRKPC